ncbi:hypothetical protein [Massilia sp. NP310]|uniref:hypothetical protein n=1 Tax=Massilia sp. NP310 TaxID=2861282 RepID=UPI001C62A868|nr:hypothetical protein [Massilia sp. NP310]QYG04009.1 hypothetical protein KY496_11825 [Massilia sp. NP310]
MRVPKPIINGGEQWLTLAMQRFRALKASASPLHTRTQIIQPDQDTTIEVHVSPSVDRIKIDSNGLEVSSGLVNIGTLSLPTDPPTPRKFRRFYPGSIQADPDKRAWIETVKLNYRPADLQFTPYAQATTLRSTMFTGAMEKVVSVALGANKPIPWSWKWNKTHGVHFDIMSRPWLIEVSADNGVLAMKFPLSKGVKPKATESAVQNSLGFLPGFTSFPSSAEKLNEALMSGAVLRLASAEDLSDFYTKEPMRDHIGWAFNPDGSECQNVAIGLIGTAPASFRFRIAISTSEDGPTAATIMLQDSGKGYGIRKYSGYHDADGNVESRYCDGTRMFFGSDEPEMLGKNFSRDDEFSFGELALGEVVATEMAPSRAPVFVFYDDGGIEQVFYQDIYSNDGLRFSGQPARDFFPGNEGHPGAVYSCDFSGPGVPPHKASAILEPESKESVVYLGQSQPFSVLDSQTPPGDPPKVDPYFEKYAGYNPGPGEFEATVGIYAKVTEAVQPAPKSFSSNTLLIPSYDRSSVFIINNSPTFTPQISIFKVVAVMTIHDGKEYLWFPAAFPPVGIPPGGGGIFGPSAASAEANFAYLRLESEVITQYPATHESSASLTHASPQGERTYDISSWVDFLKIRSIGWRTRFSGLSGIVPLWTETLFAGFFIDFSAAVDQSNQTSKVTPTGCYAASGRSAFLRSSYNTKTPSPHIPNSTLNLDAMDGEPLSTAEPVAIFSEAATTPLMLGWVGYS